MCIIFILRHVYLAGWLHVKIFYSPNHCAIMEQKLNKLMAEIHQSKCSRRMTSRIAVQSSNDTRENIPGSCQKDEQLISYRFKKRSHEHQNLFNVG